MAESDRHRIEVGRDYVRFLIDIKCGLVLIRAAGNIHDEMARVTVLLLTFVRGLDRFDRNSRICHEYLRELRVEWPFRA